MSSLTKPSQTILVIDDNPINLKLLRILLTGEGYNILTASDGEEALSVMSGFIPDLILMDIQLPGIDGLTLTRQLKANPEYKNIVIIAVTSFALKGDKEKALDAGCDDYITKPIDTMDLPVRILHFLANKIPIS
jgi:CheY-like chemotaxis protein